MDQNFILFVSQKLNCSTLLNFQELDLKSRLQSFKEQWRLPFLSSTDQDKLDETLHLTPPYNRFYGHQTILSGA